MPLSENDAGVEAPPQKDWTPIAEDVYQVVIKDIEAKDGTKYQSDEPEVQYILKFVVLTEGEFQQQMVSAFASRKWFTGTKKTAPSKLIKIFKAIYGFYYPKLDVSFLEAEDITNGVINDLIGKQLKVTVKLNDEKNGNKVTDFMVIKEELAIPEEIKIDAPKFTAKPRMAEMAEKAAAKEEGSKTEEGEEDTSDLPF